MRQLTKSVRFALAIAILALNGLVILMLVYSLNESRKEHEREVRATIEGDANLIEQNIAASVQGIDLTLREIIGNLEEDLQSRGRLDARKTTEMLVDRQNWIAGNAEFRASDSAGVIRYGSGILPASGFNVADRDYFQSHRSRKDSGLIISNPLLSRVSKTHVIIFSRRYNQADGSFAGIVSAAVPIGIFGKILSLTNLGPHGAALLRDAETALVAIHPPTSLASQQFGTKIFSKELAELIKSGVSAKTYRAETSGNGFERTNAYRRLSSLPYHLVVGMAPEDYLAPWHDLVQLAVLAAAAFLVFSTTLVLLLGRALKLSDNASKRYRALLRHASDGIHILDDQGKLVEASDSFCSMLGYARTELMGMHVARWDARFTPEKLRDELSLMLEQATVLTFQTRHRRKDGSFIDVEVTSYRLELDERQVLYFASRDITGRLAMEARLRTLAQAIEQSPVSIVIANKDGNIEYVNPRFTAVTGYSGNEVIGQNPRILNSGATPPETYVELWQALTAGVEWHGTFHNRRKNGDLIWENASISPICNDNGELTHYVAVKEDVTERKRIEAALAAAHKQVEAHRDHLEEVAQALKESNTFQHTILNSVAAHVAVIDRDGAILAVNEPWQRFSLENGMEPGVPAPNTGIGSNYFAICGGDSTSACGDAIDARQGIRAVLDGNSPRFSMEYPCDSPTEQRWFMMTVIPTGQDRTNGAVITHANITERKRIEASLVAARAEAESATRSKSEFLANMSHDIRTPMNGVIGMVELMLDDELTPSQRQRAIIISSSAKSLLRLLNDILDYSKIEAGKLELEAIDFNFRQILEDLVLLFSITANEKRLDFSCNVDPQVPHWLNGDPARLKQILNNLLSNAVKFTESGAVRMIAEVEDVGASKVTLRLEVFDTGVGIAPEYRDKMFSAFSQADISTSRKFGGTGLGLAICKQLSELMGGSIGVAALENGGSVFRVTIPFGIGRAPGQALVHAVRRERAGLSCKLLLAEDNPVNRVVALGTLKKLGYSDVTVAVNGKDAVDKVADCRFDAILMDVQMPIMSGYAATAILRERGCVIPIIAITANALKGDREKCLEAGMDDYVSKPIEREILAGVLRKWIGATSTATVYDGTPDAGEGRSNPPVSAVSQAAAPLSFDRARFRELLDGDEQLMAEVLAIALERLPMAIASLEAALDAGNNDEAERHAHSIKGSAANVGALALSALALQMECQAAEVGCASAGGLLETLKGEFDRFRSAVADVE
jgi:PAS domain S-box-containing protein